MLVGLCIDVSAVAKSGKYAGLLVGGVRGGVESLPVRCDHVAETLIQPVCRFSLARPGCDF